MTSPALHPNTLGIDFGTSNSAAGIAMGDRPFLVDMEPGETTLPTAVFFEPKRPMRIGRAATRALINGDEGRFMRALKSLLGTPLLREGSRSRICRCMSAICFWYCRFRSSFDFSAMTAALKP